MDYKFLFKDKLKPKKIIKSNVVLNKLSTMQNLEICGYIRDFKIKKIRVHRKYLTNITAIKKIVRYAIPATLTLVMSSIISFVDSIFIINLLVDSGISSTVATSLYGINNGVVNTLIGLPVVVIVAVSTAVVPNLSSLIVRNKSDEVKFRVSFFLKITWILSLFMFFVYLILSPEFIGILFRNGLNDQIIDEFNFAYRLLTLSSVSILYYGFLQVFTAILQAFDKPILPFIALFLSFIIRTILCYLLVRINSINIFGVVIANLVYLSLSNFILYYFVSKKIEFNLGFKSFILKPLLCSIVSAVVMYLSKFALKGLPIWLYTSISGLFGGIVFIWLVFVIGVFNSREMKQMPKFKIKLFKKFKT